MIVTTKTFRNAGRLVGYNYFWTQSNAEINLLSIEQRDPDDPNTYIIKRDDYLPG